MSKATAARTYNQNHVPRKYTPGKRRVSMYVAWSYPAEAGRNPYELDNRFSTMTEVRRVAWPEYEAPEWSDPLQFQQGIAGSLDFDAIVNLVGDKLREVFRTGDIGIGWIDRAAGAVRHLYAYEHGQRLDVSPTPLEARHQHIGIRALRKIERQRIARHRKRQVSPPLPPESLQDSQKRGVA